LSNESAYSAVKKTIHTATRFVVLIAYLCMHNTLAEVDNEQKYYKSRKICPFKGDDDRRENCRTRS